MLKCATSLWSADLANLASDMCRVEPYSDRFHIDVADGHYVPQLLFFPDLVRQLRPHTKLPFDILAGSSELRQQIEAALPVRTIYYSWIPAHERFRATRKPFLLY